MSQTIYTPYMLIHFLSIVSHIMPQGAIIYARLDI